MNPDILRQDERVLEFIWAIYESGKPVAAICHSPWTLIDAGLVNGKKITSYKSLRTDLENAGAEWVDQSVVVDNRLITSRTPEDLQDFCRTLIEEIEEGVMSANRGAWKAECSEREYRRRQVWGLTT